MTKLTINVKLSGQGSADPAQPAFSLGPRNEEIRDSSPSGMLISSTDSSKGDPMVAVRDQDKDSQTTPGQDILSTEHPSGKVQENIPGDKLGKAEPSRPSSAIQEGKASASGIQLGSLPNELSVAPPGNEVLSSTDWTNSAHSSSCTLQTNCPATSKVYLPFQVKILSTLCRRLSLLNQQKKTLLLLQQMKPAHLKEQLIKIT